ncbi:hypothetical protein DL93DRAFT_2072264 [Clavulina sp. PMI_390]|nr:hypothetical protein DL93DRAFT_2072264 [Clavulina sp. PMI_390]
MCGIVATPYQRNDILAAGTSSRGTASPPPLSRPASLIGRALNSASPDSETGSVRSGNGANLTYGGLPVDATAHSSTTNVIVHKDSNITAYVEKKFPVSSKGHIILVLNLHVPNIYSLSPNDLPLLSHIQAVANQLLYSLNPPPVPSSPGPRSNAEERRSHHVPLNASSSSQDQNYRVGFITPPWKDNKIPITDHLHCHAFIGTPDLAGWWRGVAYSGVAWYPIQDLIAEIRESVSNNRIKSGYENRGNAPIDMVPGAGSVSGTADGRPEQFLPLPLNANKPNMSPAPTPNPTQMNIGSSTSLLGGQDSSSSSVNLRGIPSLRVSTSGVEHFDQTMLADPNATPTGLRSGYAVSPAVAGGGSVDLGSFRSVPGSDAEFFEPSSAQPAQRQNSTGSSGAQHKPRESFDEAAWEGMDGSPGGTFEGDEGQAGPGPNTIKALHAVASS